MSRLITPDDLPSLGIRYSRVQLWRLWRAGRFPRPVRLGHQRIAWPEAEIEAWIKSRIAERDATAGEAA